MGDAKETKDAKEVMLDEARRIHLARCRGYAGNDDECEKTLQGVFDLVLDYLDVAGVPWVVATSAASAAETVARKIVLKTLAVRDKYGEDGDPETMVREVLAEDTDDEPRGP